MRNWNFHHAGRHTHKMLRHTHLSKHMCISSHKQKIEIGGWAGWLSGKTRKLCIVTAVAWCTTFVMSEQNDNPIFRDLSLLISVHNRIHETHAIVVEFWMLGPPQILGECGGANEQV